MPSEFQQRATAEGRLAQDWAGQLIRGVGFSLQGRNVVLAELGVTVNYVADDQLGNTWHFDVSGAATSERAGLRRTDTVWKALGRASLMHLAGIERVVMLTSDLPASGSVGDKALRAGRATFFDVLDMMSPAGKARLRRYATGEQIKPLPGFLTPQEIFGDAVRSGASLGASIAVPLDLIGDPVGTISPPAVSAMHHRMVAYIPSQTEAGEPIPSAVVRRAQERIIKILGDFAGGCTTVQADGSWADPLAGVVNERVQVVESFSARPFPQSVIHEVVQVVLGDLEQHTAALLINQSMYQFSRS